MVFQAISPTFWGTLADSWGRRPVLLGTMVCYCAACIGLALAPSYAALLVFRMLEAFGSSSVIAVAGVLSDIVTSEKYVRSCFYESKVNYFH
jgi:MFS family permease